MASNNPYEQLQKTQPESTLENLGISKSLNNKIGLITGAGELGAAGAAIAGGTSLLDLGAGGTAGATAEGTEAETAAENDLANQDRTGAGTTLGNGASTLLKDATIGGILGGLLTWGPLRILELLIGIALLFIGLHALTGINPEPALKAAVS